ARSASSSWSRRAILPWPPTMSTFTVPTISFRHGPLPRPRQAEGGPAPRPPGPARPHGVRRSASLRPGPDPLAGGRPARGRERGLGGGGLLLAAAGSGARGGARRLLRADRGRAGRAGRGLEADRVPSLPLRRRVGAVATAD